MPSDPDNKRMDETLKALAKKRRDEAGAPFELHPATRRLLQGEVARAFPKPAAESKPGFRAVLRFWPRLAFAAAVFAVLGIVCWVSFLGKPAHQRLTPLAKNTEIAPVESFDQTLRDTAKPVAVDKPAPANADKRFDTGFVRFDDETKSTEAQSFKKSAEVMREKQSGESTERFALSPQDNYLPKAPAAPAVAPQPARGVRAPAPAAEAPALPSAARSTPAPPASRPEVTLNLDAAQPQPTPRPVVLHRSAPLTGGGLGGVARDASGNSAPPVGGLRADGEIAQRKSAALANGSIAQQTDFEFGIKPVGQVAAPQGAITAGKPGVAADNITSVQAPALGAESRGDRGAVPGLVTVRSETATFQREWDEAADAQAKADKLQQFYRESVAAKIAAPQNVLAHFDFDQEGDRIQIREPDGSVYEGRALTADESENLAAAPGESVASERRARFQSAPDLQKLEAVKRQTADPASGRAVNFRVSGTNRTLRQLVVLQGAITSDDPATARARSAMDSAKFASGAPATTAAPQPAGLATQPTPATRLKARARIGAATNEIEINAVRVAR